MTLRPGVQLGPYEIQRLIGRGGMGEVYQAVDTRLRRPVAIKVLADDLTSSAQAMERLQREARTASILHHPNICTIYDIGTTPPLFIAMVGRRNIWTRPLSGGTPMPLTHFEDRVIADFDYSPDGKQIVVVRRLETNDIVVLKGLRRD